MSEVVKSIDWSSPQSIGAAWIENSSLERWFPITAQAIAMLESHNQRLKEMEAILNWADNHIVSIDKSGCPAEWWIDWDHEVENHHASTLYAALKSAWEGCDK